jgi:hypothetical protein
MDRRTALIKKQAEWRAQHASEQAAERDRAAKRAANRRGAK